MNKMQKLDELKHHTNATISALASDMVQFMKLVNHTFAVTDVGSVQWDSAYRWTINAISRVRSEVPFEEPDTQMIIDEMFDLLLDYAEDCYTNPSVHLRTDSAE